MGGLLRLGYRLSHTQSMQPVRWTTCWGPILVDSVMWWAMETNILSSHIIRLLPAPLSLQCVTGEHSPIQAMTTHTNLTEPWWEVPRLRMITTRMTGLTTSWLRSHLTTTQDSREQWLDSWLQLVRLRLRCVMEKYVLWRNI